MASFRTVFLFIFVAEQVSTADVQDQECSGQDESSLLQQQQLLQRRALRVENSSKIHLSFPSMEFHRYAKSESSQPANYTSSFLDEAGLICYDGNGRDVEGLLGLLKAGVAGTLFVNTHAQAHTSCEGRGYTLNATESTCYPNVMTYAMTSSGFEEQVGLISQAITHYSHEYNISLLTAQSMFDCICHPQSHSIMMRLAGSCAATLDGIWGSWRHRDDQDEKLLCDEAPFQYATFMLAIMKTSGQLPMHLHDQIAPLRCADVGFPYYNNWWYRFYENESTMLGLGLGIPPDHCFPQARMATATQLGMDDPGILQCQALEGYLMGGGGFYNMAVANNWDHNILLATGGCQCLPGSEAWNDFTPNEQINCATPGMPSPIRDWWSGQAVG